MTKSDTLRAELAACKAELAKVQPYTTDTKALRRVALRLVEALADDSAETETAAAVATGKNILEHVAKVRESGLGEAIGQAIDISRSQVPTLGRIVHFTDDAGRVFPGIITHVYNDTCVDLVVFGDTVDTVVGVVSSATRWVWPPRA